MNEEDHVNFDAKIGKWISIKKIKIKPDTEKAEVSRILASIHDSMHRKIWDFLTEEINLEELNKIAYEITGAQFDKKKKTYLVKGRKSEAQIAEALAKCNSPSTTKKITKSPNKYYLEIAKTYLTRKVIDLLGVRIEIDPKIIEKYMEQKNRL